jgi:hypothetical protein
MAATVLIDEVLPEYDVNEVHSISVNASREVVFEAMKAVTLRDMSVIVLLLLWLRAIPERMVGRKGKAMDVGKPFLSTMLEKKGFTLLDEEKHKEIVFGMMVPASIGRVWRASSGSNVTFADAREFLTFNGPDYIRVVASLRLEDSGRSGIVTVRTESRCKALSDHALKEFLPYWRIIRPFSGLIRLLWLRGIRRTAEQGIRNVGARRAP